jgi:hypothetical protein
MKHLVSIVLGLNTTRHECRLMREDLGLYLPVPPLSNDAEPVCKNNPRGRGTTHGGRIGGSGPVPAGVMPVELGVGLQGEMRRDKVHSLSHSSLSW